MLFRGSILNCVPRQWHWRHRAANAATNGVSLTVYVHGTTREMQSVPFVSQGWLRQGYDYHQSQQVKKEGKKRKTRKPLWWKQGDVKRGNKNALHAGCLTRPDPGFFTFPHFLFFFIALCRPLQYIVLQFYLGVFLLHFKVAENNTLNGKMKYVPSPACYLSATPAPSLPS